MTLSINQNTVLTAKKVGLVLLATVVLFGSIWAYGGIRASGQALGYANLSKNDVSYVRFELDLDDMLPKYDVKWYEGQREVEYTVHALTGQLLEVDYD